LAIFYFDNPDISKAVVTLIALFSHHPISHTLFHRQGVASGVAKVTRRTLSTLMNNFTP
jgi:hypothetical protein